jgi:hypothetical protein
MWRVSAFLKNLSAKLPAREMVAGGLHNIAEFQPSLREPQNPIQPLAVAANSGKSQRLVAPRQVIAADHFGNSP